MSLTLGDLGVVRFNRSGGYEGRDAETWSHNLATGANLASLDEFLVSRGLVAESSRAAALRYALLRPEDATTPAAAALAQATLKARAHAVRHGVELTACAAESSFVVERDCDSNPQNDRVVAILVRFVARAPFANVRASVVVDVTTGACAQL